jgi:Ca-activated chloride channel homolog
MGGGRVGRFRPATIVLALVSGAGLLAAYQDTIFRAEVRLVRLLVTVKDPAGNLIGDLTRTDFAVFDNDVEQQVAVFEHHTAQPLSVTLLVDTSGSTAKDLKYETDSAAKFLKALFSEGNQQDTAGLYSFNWQVTREASFTRRVSRLEDGLRRLRAEGGTSLYDGVVLAAGDLESRPAGGRRVVIVVTDGGDTTSSSKYPDALAALHRADAVMYAILVVPISNNAGRNIGGEHALATLTKGSGGKVFTPSEANGLDQAFAAILRDLRAQYLIGYYPRNTPYRANRFHQVRIDPPRAGLQVQTRTGYYGGKEESASGR